MKSEIDALVRGILSGLDHPCFNDPQLKPLFKLIHTQRAYEQREVLARYVGDDSSSNEDRHYARKQLEALPPF